MQTNAKTAGPGAERKRPDRKPKKQAPAKKAGPQTAQQTIPYREIFKDGICRVNDRLYTKSMEYEDINYQLAQADDQSAIFDGYCAFLNSFDSSLPFQLSFINHRSRPESKYKLNIPMKEDGYSDMRSEYVEMLEGQIAKSNNGIVRTKLLTFGVSADSLAAARPRLERVEADISSNFKKLGVQSRPLNGLERLEILHGQLHPGGTESFRFTWDMIPKTGMGTKDFIAPTSFDFRQTRLFRMGSTWGAASYMQIMASELSDKLLAELLEVDAEMTITMHIQTVDQAKAIKTIKGKVSDIDKMKVEEQKKAVRSGYDMDILPPDLVTFSQDAKNLLNDLQSRNERMFLLTFLVVNTAATRRELDNDLFTVSGIRQYQYKLLAGTLLRLWALELIFRKELSMTKLEKIDKELSKAREKAAEWQTKIRDLEKQRQEEENSMIVQAVRSLKLTPAELAEFFSNPGITASGQLGPKSDEAKEDTEHEE